MLQIWDKEAKTARFTSFLDLLFKHNPNQVSLIQADMREHIHCFRGRYQDGHRVNRPTYTVFWPIVFLNDKKERERERNPSDREKPSVWFSPEGGIGLAGQSSTFGPAQSKGAWSSSTKAYLRSQSGLVNWPPSHMPLPVRWSRKTVRKKESRSIGGSSVRHSSNGNANSNASPTVKAQLADNI